MDNEKYISGFNHGYILTKGKSDLSDSILGEIVSKGDYVQGMKDGQKQFYEEAYKELMASKKEEIPKTS